MVLGIEKRPPDIFRGMLDCGMKRISVGTARLKSI